jgi:CheY-like chemotaxis protein
VERWPQRLPNLSETITDERTRGLGRRIRLRQMETDRPSKPGELALGENPSLRLLVVEDHSDLRGALKAYVGMLGYPAHFVEDAASALLLGADDPYDVLLCDIDLPDGTGWDLLRMLNETGRRPFYAIAMSVFNLGEDVAKSKAAGFALHLFKPIPTGDLKKALEQAPARTFVPAHGIVR